MHNTLVSRIQAHGAKLQQILAQVSISVVHLLQAFSV